MHENYISADEAFVVNTLRQPSKFFPQNSKHKELEYVQRAQFGQV